MQYHIFLIKLKIWKIIENRKYFEISLYKGHSNGFKILLGVPLIFILLPCFLKDKYMKENYYLVKDKIFSTIQ